MDKLLKGEELWWSLKPHQDSTKAIEKLAEAFHLPMPSGVAVWDNEQRVVALNDDVAKYMAQARGTPTRSVHSWRQYVCRRGWLWSYYFRSAEEGGSILMFQLPMPRPVNPVEQALEPEEAQVVEEPKAFVPKVVRNTKRKAKKVAPKTEWEQEYEGGFYQED